MSIASSLASFTWQDRKINLIDTPGEPELRRGRAGGTARVRGRGVRGERRHGRRGQHGAALAARGGARARTARVREHARPRARRLLPDARVPQGLVRPARRRHGDPDRQGARRQRRDRPDRHEGVLLRGRLAGQLQGDPDPGRAPGAGRGVPREADGRGRRGLRRADGALPRGRGDLARGDRPGAQERRHERHPLPGHVRRRDQEPRHQPPARRARRGPAVAGQDGRLPRRRPRHRGRGRGRDDRVRVQDARRRLRGEDQPAARLPRRYPRRLAAVQHPRAREGADGPAARPAGQGDGARRRARRRATSARSRS